MRGKVLKWLYVAGIVLFLLGTLDPMEGSVLIAVSSVLFWISLHQNQHSLTKFFAASSIAVLIGVLFLFYLSSLGGFGEDSALSIWWSLCILPYPLGWLSILILLLILAFKKKSHRIVIK